MTMFVAGRECRLIRLIRLIQRTQLAKLTRHTKPTWLSCLLASFLLLPVAAQACSSRQVAELFEYEARTQLILDIEAAMARAQARHGHIPQAAADEITRKADVTLVSEEDFDAEYAIRRHRMVALLNVWRRSLEGEGAQYVHYGATTVDIYDTASILQINRVIVALDACLASGIAQMSGLALAHRETVMIGRTLGQHAQPITFGKKVSSWLGEFARHRERLAQLRERVRRSAILKGAVGNYSGLGPDARAIEASFAAELGMAPPYPDDWHGTRDVIAEFGQVLALISKSQARIGQEIFLLQSSDVGEVRESLPAGTVGSSSMPHKRNPVTPERLIHAGRVIPRLAAVLSDDVVNFYERDNTSRVAPIIEDISVQSVASARRLVRLVGSLEVDSEAMRRNIDRTGGFAMSQKVAQALSEHVERTEAEALVKAAIARTMASHGRFAEVLASDPVTGHHLSAARIAQLLNPAHIDAPAIRQVDAVVAAVSADEVQ